MVLEAIQPHLDDIVYEMASTAEPIPLKGVVEGFCDVAPAISNNSKEVHNDYGTVCNDYAYTTKTTIIKCLKEWKNSVCDGGMQIVHAP